MHELIVRSAPGGARPSKTTRLVAAGAVAAVALLLAACPSPTLPDDYTGEADVVIVVPRDGQAELVTDAVTFALDRLDLYLLLDDTTSMMAERDALFDSWDDISAAIEDPSNPERVYWAAGRIGTTEETSFENLSTLGAEPGNAWGSFASLTSIAGSLETTTAALVSAVTGLGSVALADDYGATELTAYPGESGCPAGTIGYPCFREGALRWAIVLTDEEPGAPEPTSYDEPTIDETTAAASAAGVRITGVDTLDSSSIQDRLEELAFDTGAVDGNGTPLLRTGAGSEVVQALSLLLGDITSIDYTVSLELEDDPGDALDVIAAFTPGFVVSNPADQTDVTLTDLDADLTSESFQLALWTDRAITVSSGGNTTVFPGDAAQVFGATLRARDATTDVVLSEWSVAFVVPPAP